MVQKENQGYNHISDPLALSQGIFLLYTFSKDCYYFSMCLEIRVAHREFENLKMTARENEHLQLESVPKVADNIDSLSIDHLVKMEIMDWIGVDNFFLHFILFSRSCQQFEDRYYLKFVLRRV